MYVTIKEYDNQGTLAGLTSIEFADIHTITVKTKTTGSGKVKREFTLLRRSDTDYTLDAETREVIESPPQFKAWLDNISKHLKI